MLYELVNIPCTALAGLSERFPAPGNRSLDRRCKDPQHLRQTLLPPAGSLYFMRPTSVPLMEVGNAAVCVRKQRFWARGMRVRPLREFGVERFVPISTDKDRQPDECDGREQTWPR